MGRARAFALVEVVVVVGLFAVLLAACVPMLREERRQASIKADLNSMRLIGQASAMYSGANAGRLFTYSWEPGQVPVTPNKQLALACANLNPFNGSSLLRAPTLQMLDLVTYGFKDERLPPVESVVPTNTLPHIGYNNLVLAMFMGAALPSELFISRGDKHRTYWLNHLDEYLDDPASSPARPPTASTDFGSLWRYPFSSSYQVGVSHFSNDTIISIAGFPSIRTAERASNHRTWFAPTEPGVLGRRNASEIAFPSMKVMMFDEFDRYSPKGQSFFALPGASNIMNFYDGHATRLLTEDANYGFSPNDPTRGADTPDQPVVAYFYTPISWWDPPSAVRTFVPVYYDQTRGGLQGIDYPGGRSARAIRGTAKSVRASGF